MVRRAADGVEVDANSFRVSVGPVVQEGEVLVGELDTIRSRLVFIREVRVLKVLLGVVTGVGSINFGLGRMLPNFLLVSPYPGVSQRIFGIGDSLDSVREDLAIDMRVVGNSALVGVRDRARTRYLKVDILSFG